MFGRRTRSQTQKEKEKGKGKKDTGESSSRDQPQPVDPDPRGLVDYDSDPDDEESYYDPAAATLEKELGFSIPTRRMFQYLTALLDRTIENTRMVDMSALETFGVADDFRRLTAAVGFGDKFWGLKLKTYRKPTLEFLSSLRIKYDKEEKKNYIKFRLSNQTHLVKLEDIGKLMGFDPNYDAVQLFYRDDWSKLDFWKMITGLTKSERYKTRFIQHPVIRFTQRILAQTIFARGESANIFNDNEGQLLDSMLRHIPVKPYLAFLMAEHWIQSRNMGRSGGSVTMGGYVTLIARHYKIRIDQSETCPAPDLMNLKYFSDIHFVKFKKEDGQTRYHWQVEGREPFYLPYLGPIDADPTSWLVPIEYAPFVQVGEHWEIPDDDDAMHVDPPNNQPQDPYGMPQDQPQWFNQFITLSLSTRDEVREVRRLSEDNSMGITRINERLDVVEDNQYAWNFRYDYGYWQGGDDDPNLYPPQEQQQPQQPQEDPFGIFPPYDQPARLSDGHDFSMP